MAKLIGTDPNQVPTNADLGTAAYVDLPHLAQTDQIVQHKFMQTYDYAIYNLSQNTEQDLLTYTITPKYADSHMLITVHWQMGMLDATSDVGYAIRRDVGGSLTGFVNGSNRPDNTRGRFTVSGIARDCVWWLDDAPHGTTYNVESHSISVMDTYTGTDARTYTFTAGTSGAGRRLDWNMPSGGTTNHNIYGGGSCSLQITEIRQ